MLMIFCECIFMQFRDLQSSTDFSFCSLINCIIICDNSEFVIVERSEPEQGLVIVT